MESVGVVCCWNRCPSEFQTEAVLEITRCLEEENETIGITTLRLWLRVIEGEMCCK